MAHTLCSVGLHFSATLQTLNKKLVEILLLPIRTKDKTQFAFNWTFPLKKPQWLNYYVWCEQCSSSLYIQGLKSLLVNVLRNQRSVVNGHTAVHHLNQSSQLS